MERKPDFLAKCVDPEGNAYVLHVEYQTSIDTSMLSRMITHYGLILEKYQLPIFQFIFYTGKEPYTAPTRHQAFSNYFEFAVWDIKRTDYQQLLTSTYPEEVLLAIHSNFQGQPPEAVTCKIFERLQQLAPDKNLLRKYVIHLTVISNLEKLEDTVIHIAQEMDIFDEKQFPSYQRGVKEGEKRGEKRGEQRGEKRGAQRVSRQNAANLIRLGKLTDDEVAQVCELSLDEVAAIRKEVENESNL